MKIQSKSQYRRALTALEALMTKSYVTPHDTLIARLAEAIEEYELIHYPIADPTPEEAAAFRKAEEPKKT